MKLLVVDDEAAILEEIVADLTESGHTVTTAENGSLSFFATIAIGRRRWRARIPHITGCCTAAAIATVGRHHPPPGRRRRLLCPRPPQGPLTDEAVAWFGERGIGRACSNATASAAFGRGCPAPSAR